MPTDYHAVSHWMSDVDDELAPRPALAGDVSVDVVVIGAGYTGLWTAYYLARADPALRIAVVEAKIAGYGASGRNGGWCSALFPQSLGALARRYGRDSAVALYRELQATVDEVGRVAAAEGIECHYAKGGTVTVARTEAQLVRARDEVAQARAFGFGPEDLQLLDAARARERCGATGVLGGTYTPHCAAIHPARLVRGLARVVERLGVRIYEHTPALSITPRRAGSSAAAVRCATGTVCGEVIVRATEGYTARLPGHRRVLAPIYSLMICTEPLPPDAWATIGLAARETFSDYRHLLIYGQRTADDRLAFGGRGAPYHFGSAVQPAFDAHPRVHQGLARALGELFPVLEPVRISHAWGGPIGVPQDWTPSVGFDPVRGLAWAGGYVGDGVAASNLAGRTLAHLITGERSDLTALPWVNHRSPRWVPEPLRWLGVNAGLRLMASADSVESRTGRPSRRAALFGRLLGH